MRFVLIGACCIALSTFQSYSQSFRSELFAGCSATQVAGDELAGFNKTGFTGGASVYLPLSQKWEAALELMYIQKGSRKKTNPDKNDYTSYLMKLNYIEVPVMIRFILLKKIRLETGISIAKLISSSEENEYGDLPDRKPFHSYDLSAYGGLSYCFFNNFVVHTRLGTSIIPIRNKDYDDFNYYFAKDQYNSVLFFTLRYMINPKKSE